MADTIYKVNRYYTSGERIYLYTTPVVPNNYEEHIIDFNTSELSIPSGNFGIVLINNPEGWSDITRDDKKNHIPFSELQTNKQMVIKRLQINNAYTYFVGIMRYTEISTPTNKPLLINGKKVKSISIGGKNVKSFTIGGKTYTFEQIKPFDFTKEFDIEVIEYLDYTNGNKDNFRKVTSLTYTLVTYQRQQRAYSKTFSNGTWTWSPNDKSLLNTRVPGINDVIFTLNSDGNLVLTKGANVEFFVGGNTFGRVKLTNKDGKYATFNNTDGGLSATTTFIKD